MSMEKPRLRMLPTRCPVCWQHVSVFDGIRTSVTTDESGRQSVVEWDSGDPDPDALIWRTHKHARRVMFDPRDVSAHQKRKGRK
jgi:hypothetical protein